MQTVGNYLKSGREAKNISLSEVARTTKISKWYLDCLEQDEFDKMPGGPYIKGYITSYAAFIGIAEDEVLKRYDSLQLKNIDDNHAQNCLRQIEQKQTFFGILLDWKKTIILSLVILILAALGAYYFRWQNQWHTDLSNSTKESTGRQAPGVDASKPETKLSVRPPIQNYTPTLKPKHFSKIKVLLPETRSRIQGASISGNPIPETVLPPPQHGFLPVVPRDPQSAPVQSEALTASQDSESSGRPTEPIRPQSMSNIKIVEAVA